MRIKCLRAAVWAVAAFSLAGQALADAAAPEPVTSASPFGSPAPALAAVPDQALVPLAPKGTEIVIEIDEHLNSSTAKVGDLFRLHLAEPIVVNGVVVAPAGASGGGEVINAAPSGVGGRPGELTIMARYLDIDGQRITIGHLRYSRTGSNNGTTSAVAGAMAGAAGYLITGSNVDVPAGVRATAKLKQPILAPPATALNGPVSVETN